MCPFESRKGWKEAKKIQAFEYLENEKSFLDEIKSIFVVFVGRSYSEKIQADKILMFECFTSDFI